MERHVSPRPRPAVRHNNNGRLVRITPVPCMRAPCARVGAYGWHVGLHGVQVIV
jgi:hypothetical protein